MSEKEAREWLTKRVIRILAPPSWKRDEDGAQIYSVHCAILERDAYLCAVLYDNILFRVKDGDWQLADNRWRVVDGNV